ncbi:S66 peptidase family protein [Paraliomyxa miuraensis]|uniref:S66 peptidase family protein n=1 Tax=Paraliomyxa miuraensis TaxID=376150 RepID=UPI002254B7FD|nr:LD-carboxypeptidase [Paraliomyxa miuraensis]MCX4245997.1 LD-carboxypeptidase [Paraliomyxa miuraensis]
MSGRPTALRSGDRVHVVAASGPVPAERFDRGLRVLRRHLDAELVLAPNIHEQEGYFAGSDRLRLQCLHAALGDPDARVVMTARGGYGATRLLSALDPELLRRHPKLLVGFSDITALLCWAWVRAGIPSIHGPVVTQLSTTCPDDLQRLVDLLRGEVPAPIEATEGTVIHGGTVEGTLVAANLEVLRALVGTRFMPSLAGAVLAIEEVTERPYRIDRTLTHLLSAGAMRGIRGVVVGQLTDCEEPETGRYGPTAHDVVVERLATLGVPVVTGFPFGHDPERNAALPFGARVRLVADDCSLELLEPVAGPP